MFCCQFKNILFINTSNFNSFRVKSMSNIFSYCSTLASIDLSNFNTSSVTDMSGLFYNCQSLIELDLSNFNTISVINMESMFSYCYSLESISLSNFITSSVLDMSFMFEFCQSLSSLDLSNFDTHSVNNMHEMFSNCNSLIYLDLSSFNTSSVFYMGYMFYNCSSLLSLDLSNFDTSSVFNMEAMFSGCRSLISLKIDTFNVKSVEFFDYMFSNCYSLVSLNLTNFDFETDNYLEMFMDCNPNLEICIDDRKTYKFLDLFYNFQNNCDDICINWNSKKYIIEENLCIDDCASNEEYKNELDNICYKDPSRIYPDDPDKKSSKGIIFAIIGCILGLLLIAIIIVIIYKIKAKRILITFIEKRSGEAENDLTIKTKISKEKTVIDLIDIYYKKRGTQNEKNHKPKIFLYKAENLNTEKYKGKKVEVFFEKDSNEQNANNSANDTMSSFNMNVMETGIFPEINDEINNNQNRKNPVNEIIVMSEGNILIFFKEIKKENEFVQKTEICISKEKKVSDLIELYYKKTHFKKDGQKIFLCDEINLAEENYKNNEIKKYVKNSYIMKISVLEKNIIKIGFYEIQVIDDLRNCGYSCEIDYTGKNMKNMWKLISRLYMPLKKQTISLSVSAQSIPAFYPILSLTV